MAEASHQAKELDPTNGFCAKTKTFHSLRPSVPLPPPSLPVSLTDFLFSILPSSSSSSSSSSAFLIDAATDRRVTYPCFISQCRALSSFLVTRFPSLSKNDVALVLPPPSLHVPVVYFTLLSLGIVVSPANPLSSASEIRHLVGLSNPVVAFATSHAARKLPTLRHGTILIDSPEFESVFTRDGPKETDHILRNVNRVAQADPATILYSSGTTGRVKGVLMTHGNMIAGIAGARQVEPDASVEPGPKSVFLIPLPLFHVYGFVAILRAFGIGATAVLMGKFELEAMLKAVEKYGVDTLPVSPPVVLTLVKSELIGKYDLSSLRTVVCGGAPLGKEVSERFREKFPNVELVQGYALTESLLGSRMMGPDETKRYGSVGYVGDEKSTAETLDPDDFASYSHPILQVPPAELEHLLQSHPQIADAAVIPYPDEEAGQVPMAFVVRKPGAGVAESEIMDFIAEQVAPYKKIRRIAFISSIPKNPAGKILRRELISHALSAGSAKL
ncbi:hypothetical protein NL676_003375 [Syzygium grande]|nr:hypothetical protein NL676_003375 [Syzygium grande]